MENFDRFAKVSTRVLGGHSPLAVMNPIVLIMENNQSPLIASLLWEEDGSRDNILAARFPRLVFSSAALRAVPQRRDWKASSNSIDIYYSSSDNKAQAAACGLH